MMKFKNLKDLLSVIPKNSVIAEIGIQKGNSSSKILEVTEPKKFHLIDCWKYQNDETYQNDSANVEQSKQDEIYNSVIKRFELQIKQKQVIVHRMFSHDAVQLFENCYFDFVYIDADHSYKAVKKDLEMYYPKVKLGGFIGGDDYLEYGYYGVIRAANEFIKKHNLKITAITDEKTPSFIIRK